MASNSVIIVLINPKSGGKMGLKLLKMFRNLLGEEKVYNLCDDQNFGPKKALEDYKDVDNLRIIGILLQIFSAFFDPGSNLRRKEI